MTIIIRYFKHPNKVMYISKENYIQLYNLGALMDSKQLAPQEKAQNNSRRLHCSQQSMISIVTICSSRFHRLLHRKSALGRVTDGAPRPASLPPSRLMPLGVATASSFDGPIELRRNRSGSRRRILN